MLTMILAPVIQQVKILQKITTNIPLSDLEPRPLVTFAGFRPVKQKTTKLDLSEKTDWIAFENLFTVCLRMHCGLLAG